LAVSRRVRIWSYCPVIIILVQPLASSAAAQRLMQALGLDFVATVMLLIIIAVASLLKIPLRLK